MRKIYALMVLLFAVLQLPAQVLVQVVRTLRQSRRWYRRGRLSMELSRWT